jgi:hypothetical protein
MISRFAEGQMGRVLALAMVLVVVAQSSFAQQKTMTFIEAIRAGYEIKGIQIGAFVLQKGKSVVICEGEVLKAPCKVFE